MAYEVIQINENTWRIEDNGAVRFFLLTGTKEALLIDSGMTIKNAKEIAQELTDLPVRLLNTHADPDHISGNAQFETFFMHPSEASNYYNTQRRSGTFIPVEDGDQIDLGDRVLEMIAIPGHTPGSIAVLDVEKRMLFSGDPIQDGMIFMFGVQREMHAYVRSLEKLKKMKDRFDAIYPSHGSVPVKPDLIDQLHDAAVQILESGCPEEKFPCMPMDFHGTKVKRCDVGAASFLLEERIS